jgi:hypothetical protein
MKKGEKKREKGKQEEQETREGHLETTLRSIDGWHAFFCT